MDLDEREDRNGGVLPPVLREDARPDEMVKAINGLALELQFIREAFQQQGTAFETFCRRIERALGVMRERATDPAPPPTTEDS